MIEKVDISILSTCRSCAYRNTVHSSAVDDEW